MPVKAGNALDGVPIPLFSSARAVVAELHTHLRQLIVDGELPAGAELNQADLARRYNVSRTPVREAFRLLQQEGLIDVQLNQRASIRQLDPGELDQLYGVRIALESLGVRITAGQLTADEERTARGLLDSMDAAMAADDLTSWIADHRHFHAMCSARADEPLARIIHSYSERSERYLRLALTTRTRTFSSARDEHRLILDGLLAGDVEGASRLMSLHLAETAQGVLHTLGLDEARGAVHEAMMMTTGAGVPPL